MAAAAEDPVAASEISPVPAPSSSSVETAFSRYACTQAAMLCFVFPLCLCLCLCVCVLSSEICVVKGFFILGFRAGVHGVYASHGFFFNF
jgi:hypothetical protein